MGDPAPIDILTGVHVLVVDDDEDARQIIATALRAFDALVTTAASAMSALRRLSAIAPDVIVCDLAMPEVDGITFARDVRASPRLRLHADARSHGLRLPLPHA